MALAARRSLTHCCSRLRSLADNASLPAMLATRISMMLASAAAAAVMIVSAMPPQQQPEPAAVADASSPFAAYPPVFPTWPFVIHTWPWTEAADAACTMMNTRTAESATEVRINDHCKLLTDCCSVLHCAAAQSPSSPTLPAPLPLSTPWNRACRPARPPNVVAPWASVAPPMKTARPPWTP